MTQLVRLWKRPSRDGLRFSFVLHYKGPNGKRIQRSLGHADSRKAEKQRAQLERELRMGVMGPGSLKISEYVTDSIQRTGSLVRESTHEETASAAKDFIQIIGDIDFQKVTLAHGEQYRQACLDRGNSPATVCKKIAHLKALFGQGVKREQLEKNPFRFLDKPKVPRKKVVIFTADECRRIIETANAFSEAHCVETTLAWDVLVSVALETGMRKGELLNLVWSDVDFEQKRIYIQAKKETTATWGWDIKDADERTLSVKEDVLAALAGLQQRQPVGCPYVFVPARRYLWIQQLRKKGAWGPVKTRRSLINNFNRDFGLILKRAKARRLKFHTLRATALSFWIQNGMSETEVMTMAGHANFATTHKFYLAVKDDLVDRAREMTPNFIGESLSRARHAPHSGV